LLDGFKIAGGRAAKPLPDRLAPGGATGPIR